EHVALGRAREQPLAAVAEGCGTHVLLAAVDVAVVGPQDRAPGRPRLLDLCRSPLLLALPPVVIHRRSGLAQNDLLDPVASRPARRSLALEGDAPWLSTVRHDLALERHQLGPGLGHLIALRREGFGVVPDEPL